MRIKADFSRGLPASAARSASKVAKREKGIWQRRYWEHAIRDDADFERHVDYIHYNPVKHGLVSRVADWPHSSFHRYVERRIGVVMPRTSRGSSANSRVGTALARLCPPYGLLDAAITGMQHHIGPHR